jgi:acetyltransferase-like isoleucine patch superfamily enzyme
VGKYTYGFTQFCIPNINLKSIGSFCSIGNNVCITSLNHPLNCITTNPIIYKKSFFGLSGIENKSLVNTSKNRKVIIGNDVWIGDNVTILPSIKIGNGAIIGACSVITKDVPEYAIVVGNPGRILKFRFNENEIAYLKKICWWDWNEEKLKENLIYFSDPKLFFSNIFDNK